MCNIVHVLHFAVPGMPCGSLTNRRPQKAKHAAVAGLGAASADVLRGVLEVADVL